MPAKRNSVSKPRSARTRKRAQSNGRPQQPRRLGIWLVGALGDISTTVAIGLEAMVQGLMDTTGMVSETAPFEGTDLVALDQIVLGGHDVRRGTPRQQAQALKAASGLFEQPLIDAVAPALDRLGKEIQPGFLFGCGETVNGLASPGVRGRRQGPAAALQRLRKDLRRFRKRNTLEAVVVVNVASTEATGPPPACYKTADRLLAAVAADDPAIHASVLHALAAIQENCPFINFTPSFGSSVRGMVELAERLGVPHMGRDGKTGETLVKSALAPLFLARNLDVVSWTGANILGNRDGLVLEEPTAKQSKAEGKDRVLRNMLGSHLGHSSVRIDYVPGLGDWKTAWDHIHFRGFMGTRMTLQFVWQGSDSMLAAPLVLDLARLAERAQRAGRSGLLPDLGVFFKNPTAVEDHSLVHQFDSLLTLASELRGCDSKRSSVSTRPEA